MTLGSGIAVASVCALIGFVVWIESRSLPLVHAVHLVSSPFSDPSVPPDTGDLGRVIENDRKCPLNVYFPDGTFVTQIPAGGQMMFALPLSIPLVYEKGADVHEALAPLNR